MLKKNQPVKFAKPMSTMRQVLSAVEHGFETRQSIVDYIEDSHRTLDDYVRQLKNMPLNWGTHYLPHDGFTKDFKTGKSAQEIMEALGCAVEQTPNMEIESGIKAARMTFSRIYFDKTKAARLIECLKRYVT